MTLLTYFCLPRFEAKDIMPLVNSRLLGKHVADEDGNTYIVEATSVTSAEVIVLYAKREVADEAYPLGNMVILGFTVSLVVH